MQNHRNNGKIWSKTLVMLVFALTVICTSAFRVQADNDVRPGNIRAAGQKSITVYTGKDFELKVRMTPRDADEDHLKWEIISGSRFVHFDDDDLNDDEVELKAVRAGTAKIRCSIQRTRKNVTFTVKVKGKSIPEKIKSAVRTRQYVEAGDDFELKVKKYPGLKSKHLKWTIQNRRIVRFEDAYHSGDEVEFQAVRTGKTTITCKNTKTGQKITFSITVVRDDDDDYD